MFNLMLFTDGSVDNKMRIGFGAYLAVSDIGLPLSDLKTQVKVKQFENTSSTMLELQTLLCAMYDVLLLGSEKAVQMTMYTDSQNILSLPARRSYLEQRNYYSSSGNRLNNAELYQQFFRAIDRYNFQLVKLDGHKPQHSKSNLDHVFALVDKASRLALREFNHQLAVD